MPTALFISETAIKDRSFISDNVDVKYIREAILYCQDVYIQPKLGSTLYDLIGTQIVASTVTAVNQTLLDRFIQPILRWRVMGETAYFASNKVMNKGVMRQNSENSQIADRGQLEQFQEKCNSKAEWYEQRLVDYLCEHESDYPTYQNPANGVDVIQPDRGKVFTSPIFLGGSKRPTTIRGRYRDQQYPID